MTDIAHFPRPGQNYPYMYVWHAFLQSVLLEKVAASNISRSSGNFRFFSDMCGHIFKRANFSRVMVAKSVLLVVLWDAAQKLLPQK